MVMRRSKALLPARDIERHLFSQFSGFLQILGIKSCHDPGADLG